MTAVTGATIVDRRPITADDVASVLERYEVGRALDPPRPAGGTANTNCRIVTDRGQFVLRRRNPKYAVPAYVAFDHQLMEHLARRGVPTPLAVCSRSGKRWVVVNGDTYELYPFRPGRAHDRGSLAEIRAAASALAHFHEAAAAFEAPPGKEWPRYDDPAQIRAGLEEMRDELTGILQELHDHLAMIERELPDILYAALPRHVIHGDFHPANVTFTEDGQVAGIWDMDWCTVQPRIRDVADGLIFFGGVRDGDVDSSDIRKLTRTWLPDAKRFAAFLTAYTARRSLTDEELSLLPVFMRARWLHCRVIGRSKVPEDARTAYFVDGLLEPLRALDALPAMADLIHPANGGVAA
jgi:Ser/Thr protein kinase RdoA (MazF antagonist)